MSEKPEVLWRRTGPPIVGDRVDPSELLRECAQIEQEQHAEIERLRAERDALLADAERYRLLRRGQRWGIINGIGDALRADELDAAIDAAREAK